ncbi:prephenate dehydratase [Schwartzia sp. (in: firmicutes)]
MKKMGFLGPLGTHSEAAAIYLRDELKESVELVPYPDIYSVMQAVVEGELDSCLVPIENSLEGAVNITLDTLARSEALVVNRELIWGVHNHLMAKCSSDKVKTIYSHAQPLAQCREWLDKNFPDAERLEAASTAQAVKLAAESPDEACAAAIGTKRAGELYGLSVLAEEIQDNDTNCTRFYELCRQPAHVLPKGEKGRALVICDIDGSRAGSLLGVLQEFAERGVNMTRIESRPRRTELGRYIFFFDLEVEGDNHDRLQDSIAAVRKRSLWLHDLGEFPVIYALK